MKNIIRLIVIGLIILNIISVSFALPSANRALNPGIEQDTWWGGGLVLAQRWSRSPANNTYCTTTMDGNNSNGALYVLQSPSQATSRWNSALRIAVTPGMTYNCSVYAKWDNCTTSDGIQMNVEVYDNTNPPTLLNTFVPLATTGSSGGQFVKLSGSFTVPGNGNAATILIGTFGANTETWVIFDDISMKGDDDPNLLINPGFESLDTSAPASLYPSYWRRNTSVGHFFWTTSTVHSGSASAYGQHSTGSSGYRIWYNAQGATRSYVAVEQNRKYLYGGWMLWKDIDVGAVGIGIQWFNGQDSTLNTVGVNTVAGGDMAVPPTDESIIQTGNDIGTWVYVENTTIPPNDARWARVILWNASTSTTIQQIAVFDDIVFKDLPPDILITPNPASVTLGMQLQLTVSGGISPYTWQSSDTSIGTIDSNGLFTSLAYGISTVTVMDSEGYSGTLIVSVVPTSAPLFIYNADLVDSAKNLMPVDLFE